MNSKAFVETTGLSYHITLQKIRSLMLCACVTASERRGVVREDHGGCPASDEAECPLKRAWRLMSALGAKPAHATWADEPFAASLQACTLCGVKGENRQYVS